MTVGGFDLIIKKDVMVVEHSSSSVRCSLATKNERKKVMKQIGINFMTNKMNEEQE